MHDLEWDDGPQGEASLGPGARVQRAAEQADALPHAGEAVPAARPGPVPGTPVVVHLQGQLRRAELDPHVGVLGVRVPDDLSIISCDYDAVLRYAVVPITSLHLDRVEMGDAAVNMLLERIENDWTDAPSIAVKAKLVELESVRSPAGG